MADKKPPEMPVLRYLPTSQVAEFTNMQVFNHSTTEVHIGFVQVNPEILTGALDHLVRARVVMSPEIFKVFVRACQEHLAKFEAQNGAIGAAPGTVMFDAGNASS